MHNLLFRIYLLFLCTALFERGDDKYESVLIGIRGEHPADILQYFSKQVVQFVDKHSGKFGQTFMKIFS